MKEKPEQKDIKNTLTSYFIGFFASIALTFLAYILVMMHNSRHELISSNALIPAILALAVIQLIIQLVFFLHLLKESRPRWNLVILISTVGIILIMVIGSIWIMNHLNYNMTQQRVNKYVQSQDGF